MAIQYELPSLRARLSQYDEREIFNMNEFRLYNSMPPKNPGPGRLRGTKKEKQWVTFLTCCKSDGSEVYPLLVVGSAKNARCFQNRDVRNHGLY